MEHQIVVTTYEKEYEVVAKVILDKTTEVIGLSELEYYERQLKKALGDDFIHFKTYLQIHGANGGINARVAICMEGHYIGS